MDAAAKRYTQVITKYSFTDNRQNSHPFFSGGLKKLATLTNFKKSRRVVCCRAETSHTGSQPRHAAPGLATQSQRRLDSPSAFGRRSLSFGPRHEHRGRRSWLPTQGRLPQEQRTASRVRSQDSHGASSLRTVRSRACAAPCCAVPGSDCVEARSFTVRAGLFWRIDRAVPVKAHRRNHPWQVSGRGKSHRGNIPRGSRPWPPR